MVIILTKPAKKILYNQPLPDFLKEGGYNMRARGITEESIYLLEYEKQKLMTCAKSFEDLAQVFVTNSLVSDPFVCVKEEEDKPKQKKEDRQTLLWKKRLMENRELFADNLKEMASIMDHVAKKDVRVVWYPEKKKRQIIRLLEDEGLFLKDIYNLEGPGEKGKVAVCVKSRKGTTYTTTEMAGYLSVLLNRHLQACAGTHFFITDEYNNFYFEEEARFAVLTGFAKAVKETEKISGDNYSFFETENGIFTAILSDGMGSGEKACADSETVIDMAEKFMEADFSIEKTVQMINDVLLAASEDSNMSTLDLCSVDLHTGCSSFVKIGSACTYIKRENKVEKIPSVSLPLGIFHQLDVTTQIRYLTSGDYIIMLSDGIADCLSLGEGDLFIEELISEIMYHSPGEIANCIMKYVISLNKGKVRDDMTVLVMGFWENSYED